MVDANRLRLPFFYYPSGLITNIGIQSQDVWGEKANPTDLSNFEKLDRIEATEKYSIRILDKFGNYKERLFTPIQYKKWETLYYFSYDLFLSFLYLITAVYLFFATRDTLILFFFLNLSLLVFANTFLLAFNSMISLYYFSIYAAAFQFYHLIYRLRGNEIQSKWLLPQFLIAVVVGIVANQKGQDLYLLERLAAFGYVLTILFGMISVFLNLWDVISSKTTGEALLKKSSLILSIIIYLSLPICIVLFNGNPIFGMPRYVFFYVNIAFLFCFFYGTYRYSLATSFIIFTPTLVNFFLVSFWSLFYVALNILSDFLLPESYISEAWFSNILFLFLFAIYLIPSKLQIKQWIDYWFFEKNVHLRDAIESITALLSAPISMRKTILAMNRIISQTLNIENVTFLIPGEQFPTSDLRNINFIRIDANSEIWGYFKNQLRVTVSSHLEYGLGLRESLYKFLTDLGVQLAFPLKNFNTDKPEVRAMILFGEKRNKRYFTIGELKFINETTRICSMVLENYILLEDEIQKRKILRDIQTASIVDNTLRIIPPSEIKGIEYSYIVRPAVGISGDYLDIIPQSSDSVVIILGDVAGHGLGTGFLVSAIKGLVRENLKAGSGLEQIFKEINAFFQARYKGNEFMTLLGGNLDAKAKTFNYVNAGHLSLLELKPSGELVSHSKTQRVLGILDTNYQIQELELSFGTRLFLYSDGITETFGVNGEAFGEESLNDFILETKDKHLKDIPLMLEERLNIFRGSNEPTDDITFIALSFAME